MKKLTAAQTEEMDEIVAEFVRDRALDGVTCIVVIHGRGYQNVGYAQSQADQAYPLLDWAARSVQAYRAKQAN